MERVERDDGGCVNHAAPVQSVYQSRKGLSMGIPDAGSDAGRLADRRIELMSHCRCPS